MHANLFYVLCNLYLITASIAAARQYIYHKGKDEQDAINQESSNSNSTETAKE